MADVVQPGFAHAGSKDDPTETVGADNCRLDLNASHFGHFIL
ncbi:uncharacterized protein METZ01_LOCUS429646 [marine metagenome]|uniref:Uncharacterized protein n=1 Tax=marine metagenome TaxID=408172 RepID=A0A382Y086_9ZZZZ